MREPEEEESGDGEISGEIVLFYGDEEWLAWAGDVKSAAYGEWLEKVRKTGRLG